MDFLDFVDMMDIVDIVDCVPDCLIACVPVSLLPCLPASLFACLLPCLPDCLFSLIYSSKDVFIAFIKEILSPNIKKGDIVVMDNLAAHKSIEVKEIIEKCGGEVIYIPPYSPEFNPIEKAWAIDKRHTPQTRH
ncbi:transposase [Myxococcota bacterium]|nr:transposase [Myxococcota bacterium]MBU1380096.1 transposase [Myxococcota bacterium]MBU1496098.1 transposase [Myxococcota bacterium]